MYILAFSSIYIIDFKGKSFLFNFCENFVFFKHSLHKAWFKNARSPPQESRGQNENMCGEHGGCVSPLWHNDLLYLSPQVKLFRHWRCGEWLALPQHVPNCMDLPAGILKMHL